MSRATQTYDSPHGSSGVSSRLGSLEPSNCGYGLRRGLCIATALPLLSLACSVATDATPPEDEARSVHALIQVRRTETIEGEEKADALASILDVPLSTDPGEVLRVAGLRETLPSVGECRATRAVVSDPSEETEEWTDFPFGTVELVSADEISLRTRSGTHSLAPHAFPTVSDWLRGVVYTSRNQEAETLPAGSLYAILVSGAEGMDGIDAVHESPEGPSSITLGGLPLEEVTSVGSTETLDFTWAPSSNSLDIMAVSVRSADSSYTCSFSDALGVGSIALDTVARGDGDADSALPQSAFQPGSAGTLNLHRVRVEASASETEAAVVEVRFDFSVVTDVIFR